MGGGSDGEGGGGDGCGDTGLGGEGGGVGGGEGGGGDGAYNCTGKGGGTVELTTGTLSAAVSSAGERPLSVVCAVSASTGVSMIMFAATVTLPAVTVSLIWAPAGTSATKCVRKAASSKVLSSAEMTKVT